MRCVKISATALILLVAAIPATAQTTVFINEIHYDNSGTDVGEAIEIAGPAGTDLSGWSLVLYNGNGGAPYGTTSLSGTIADLCSGFGALDFTYPSNGIQNGSPDGIALVDSSSTAVQFLSYEGSFTAAGGPADGLTSTDIGVSESGGTAVGDSLQLAGTGTAYESFSWAAAAPHSFGSCNPGQTFISAPSDPVINEFVANHTGSDTFEFIEVAGNLSTDYSEWTVLEIEGDSTGAGVIDDVFPVGVTNGNGLWYTGFLSSKIENGSLTILLVEGFSGSAGDDIDTDNDGVIDFSPWARIGDSLAIDDGGTGDLHYSPVVLSGGFDGIGFTVGGASRIPNGTDTDSVADWVRNDFDGEGLPGFVGSPAVGEALNTPEAINQAETAAALVINEIDYDQQGTDTAEFVEIANVGPVPVNLGSITLELVNGSNTSVYDTIALPSVDLAPGDYFVVCGDAVNVYNCDLDVLSSIQNGSPDAVALWQGATLIDTVSYEGDTGAPYTEGSGVGLSDSSSTAFLGISRFPDGVDTDQNNVDLSARCISPGSTNVSGSSDCPEPGPVTLIINETDADTAGSDVLEFVELYDGGLGNSPLDGFVVVFYNGNGDTSYNAFDLDGYTTDINGYFLLGNADVSPAPDIIFSSNGLQNGPDAVALYQGDAAGFPNGTAITTAGLIDATVYDTNDSDDPGLLVLLNAGQPQVNEDGDGDKDNHSNQRCPNGEGGQRNTDSYLQWPPTPGAENLCAVLTVFAEIFEIQGAGAASPFDGATVTTVNNVVTAVGPNGFAMQTPTDRSDSDINTSDGIFVFTGGAPGVAVGDLVDVTGEVVEFFGMTEITGSPVVTEVGTGTVPAPVIFNASVPSPDPVFPSCAIEFECYEGMLVDVADGTVTGPNQRFNPDPIAEVHITTAPARTFREPGVEYPGLGMPPIPTWDGNPEVFELDPDKLGLPNMTIPAGSSFSAVGVIGFEFGDYELWPTQLAVNPALLPVPVRPRAPLEFTIGSLNVFRFFDDIDDPKTANANGEVIRDDFVVSTAEYLRRRDKFVSHILDILGAPDILAVQEAEKIEVLEDLAAAIAAVDPGVVYTAHLIEGNDIGTIDVGFLTRDTIAVDAVTQFGYTTILSYDGSLLNDRPPLMLEARCVADGADSPVKVIVLHGRSLSGIDDPGNGPRVRQKRLEQAQFVAQLVQDEQTADPNVELVVVGDFNAYEFTDGYVDVVGQIAGDFDPAENLLSDPDIVDPNLTKRVLTLPTDERYSFIFRGNAQALDHALTSAGVDPRVTGFEFGRGNADAAVDLINDATTPENVPLRSSDHDGFVLFLTKDLDGDGVVDNLDFCPATVFPESVPTQRLGTNRWALVDDDGVFDTKAPNGKGPERSFTLEDTAGCSCEQIIEALDLGNGHVKFGCSTGVMQNWISEVSD